MKKFEKKTRKDITLEVIALIICVISVSIGFVSISKYVKIESELTVNPEQLTYSVLFSSSEKGVYENPIEPIIESNGFEIHAERAIIDNTKDPIIKNLNVSFSEPGQKVKYDFYIYNAGEYMVYLNNINFKKASGLESFKVCLTKDGKSNTMTKEICDNIKITLKVSDIVTSSSLNNIREKYLRPRTAQAAQIIIEYLQTEKELTEEIDVLFGDISLYYSIYTGESQT